MQLEKTIVPNSISNTYIDLSIDQYFNTARLYVQQMENISQESLVQYLKSDLAVGASVELKTVSVHPVNHNYANYYFNYLSYSLLSVLIFMLYRIFSRNVYARSRENEKFLKIWNPIKANGILTIRRIKEIKTHRFRKCPHCSTMLRLPRKTGEHTVECPRCHHDFEVRIRF